MVTKLTGVHVKDMLGDYIGRVKKKLMTLSNKQNSMPADGSDEFSDYIGHVKNNFTKDSFHYRYYLHGILAPLRRRYILHLRQTFLVNPSKTKYTYQNKFE
ncbi:hypothetical protein LINPERPRIM_LOCUS7082 [Linum perenne]